LIVSLRSIFGRISTNRIDPILPFEQHDRPYTHHLNP
jgi:hypothetical protein